MSNSESFNRQEPDDNPQKMDVSESRLNVLRRVFTFRKKDQKNGSESQKLTFESRIFNRLSENISRGEAAYRLTRRHQEHYIAPLVVETILRLRDNVRNTQAIATLNSLSALATNEGFEIMNYATDQPEEREQLVCDASYIQSRINSEQYVIAESVAKTLSGEECGRADCQVWLPEASSSPSRTVEFPGISPITSKKDETIDSNRIDLMMKEPWAFASVDDITTDKGKGGKGIAGHARYANFAQIRDVINPVRGPHLIHSAVASIALINGIIVPENEGAKIITISEITEGKKGGIKNERSVDIHISPNGRFPAQLVYKLRDRTVPVIYEGELFHILVDWLQYVQPIEPTH